MLSGTWIERAGPQARCALGDEMQMVVYLLTNTVNGKRYVGITTLGIRSRWNSHVKFARHGRRTVLACAIRKYGADAFHAEPIQLCSSVQELKIAEVGWIQRLNTHVSGGRGYNTSTGGENGSGTPCSPEKRRKLAERQRGRRHSEETKSKIAASLRGRKTPEHVKAKLGGKPRSPETKAKMSATIRARRAVRNTDNG